MRAFLEEYGIAVFVIAVVVILVVMATPLGDKIKTALLGVIEKFSQKALAHIESDPVS